MSRAPVSIPSPGALMNALPLSMWKEHTTDTPSGSRSPRAEMAKIINVYSPNPGKMEPGTPDANDQRRITIAENALHDTFTT